MLIFLDAGLAYLATPKTATTAIETALRRKADIAFQRGRKHMPARRFHRRVAPFIAQTFDLQLETVAMMREPLAHLRSWYSYRTRAEKAGLPKSTQKVSFDQFVSDVISKNPPEYARINGQFGFLSNQGRLGVTHLFAYPDLDRFRIFMEERLQQQISFDVLNVSPEVDTTLNGSTFRALRRARAPEFELFEHLQTAGGYLHTPDV